MDLIILQGAAPASGGGSSMLYMLGAMFVVMYFFMIRPQMKKNKAQIAFKDSVSKKVIRLLLLVVFMAKLPKFAILPLSLTPKVEGNLESTKSSVSMDSTNLLNGETRSRSKIAYVSKHLKIGVTGGIGSGKSTVCSIFEHLGVPVYNADNRAKQLMAEDDELKKKLRLAFGWDVYDKNDDASDREYLSKIVFNNPPQLRISKPHCSPCRF